MMRGHDVPVKDVGSLTVYAQYFALTRPDICRADAFGSSS